MIVKNEAGVLPRLFDSLPPCVEEVVVIDTGSTDKTIPVLEGLCSEMNLALTLRERPWVNFGHNRTELMKLAEEEAASDYLLLLDADVTLEVDDDFPGELTADIYMMRYVGPLDWRARFLVKNRPGWYYVGAVHEYLHNDADDIVVENIDSIRMDHHADGGSWSSEGKFERYVEMLEAELEKDPTNPRNVFYLAQTYSDLERWPESAFYYEQRSRMGGWEEERWTAQLRFAALTKNGAGLVDTYGARPTRLEPLFLLAQRFNREGKHDVALLFAREEFDYPDDILFVNKWVYDYGMLFEFAIASWWAGSKEAAERANRKLLTLDLPADVRAAVERNMAFE